MKAKSKVLMLLGVCAFVNLAEAATTVSNLHTLSTAPSALSSPPTISQVATAYETNTENDGLCLESTPDVSPGEWTTSVAGAKAAIDQIYGTYERPIAALMTNHVYDAEEWLEKFNYVATNAEFLAWARVNGIYLAIADSNEYGSFLTDFCYNFDPYWDYGYYSRNDDNPMLLFVSPQDYTIKGIWFFCNGDGPSVVFNINDSSFDEGIECNYLDNVESLINGFAVSMQGMTVPQAPLCSQTEMFVDSFPITVTLTNPNGSGTIYYTLDGSAPTKDERNKYNNGDPITISNSVVTLTAMVWPDDGYFSSGAYIGKFKTRDQAVEVNGVSVPYTWLDGYYPNQGSSAVAYEALANDDSDGDGFPAWQEYLLDTDPTDYASRLYTTIRMEGAMPIFGWSHTNANIQTLGYQYVPKGRTSLDDSVGWQPFEPGHRFFKVVVEPISAPGN